MPRTPRAALEKQEALREQAANLELPTTILKPTGVYQKLGLDFRGIHIEFLDDDTSELDLEGARMSGKTWVCCAKVVLSALKYPGIEWLICRYSNETTRTKLKPEFQRIARLYGVDPKWDDDQSCFLFPQVGDYQSRVYAYGLKSQSIAESQSKVRGLGVACIWNDQSEEVPQAIADELPFGTRQPGFPHQLIFSPNPPPEDHYLTDRFPEENPFDHRKYYRVSLYDNAHNLAEGKIKELEDAFPITHTKHKSLILGMRGPNVTGNPVYEDMFVRDQHVVQTRIDPSSRILEAIDSGKHHPVWVAAQRSPAGLVLLGGLMGKRMFLEDFIPWVNHYREEWFDGTPDDLSNFKLCCDPPPSEEAGSLRFTNISILREANWRPVWRKNAAAPDVRESAIQHTAGLMRRAGAFQVNADPKRWLMVSAAVTKQSKLLIDGLEASYVWDENMVSVGSKKVRQPKSDQWVDGWQRCVENLTLNFCTGKPKETPTAGVALRPVPTGPDSWQI